MRIEAIRIGDNPPADVTSRLLVHLVFDRLAADRHLD
jgi:hypothetical protein